MSRSSADKPVSGTSRSRPNFYSDSCGLATRPPHGIGSKVFGRVPRPVLASCAAL